jgi:hypothetical protein
VHEEESTTKKAGKEARMREKLSIQSLIMFELGKAHQKIYILEILNLKLWRG